MNTFKIHYKLLISLAVILTLSTVAYATENPIKSAIKNALSSQNDISPQAAVCSGEGANQVCIENVVANSGPTEGGTLVTIVGSGFPNKAKTSDYVQSGLVSHYDGINNNNTGDLDHKSDLAGWVDLKSGTLLPHFGTIQDGKGWKFNGFQISEEDGFKGTRPTAFPTGNNERTVEVVYKTPDDFNSNDMQTLNQLFAYGNTSDTQYFGVLLNRNGNCDASDTYKLCINAINGGGKPADFAIWNTAIPTKLKEAGTINAISSAYKDNVGTNSKVFLNGASVARTGSTAGTSLNTGSGDPLYIGARSDTGTANQRLNSNKFTILSVRVYNRAIIQSEALSNYEVDQQRFLSPPVVYIGGQECTDMTVISDHTIQCKTPEHAEGIVSAKIVYNNQQPEIENAYTYNKVNISSISPAVGPQGGTNTVTLYGENFPYASTEDYITDGLVSHFDAIDNQGLGDKYHSKTVAAWTDLVSGQTAAQTGAASGGDGWLSNGFRFSNSTYFSMIAPSTGPYAYPIGNTDRSIEITYKNASNYYGASSEYISPFSYGEEGAGLTVGILFHKNSECTGGGTKLCLMPLNGHNAVNDYYIVNSRLPQSYSTPSVQNTISMAYHNSPTSPSSKAYLNGTYFSSNNTSASGSLITPANSTVFIGRRVTSGTPAHFTGFTISSVRVYNKQISEQESLTNWAVDQIRFVQTPTVQIGGNACTDVVVLSTTKLQCTAPEGTSGAKNVTYQYGNTNITLTGGYTYATADDTIVSVISPDSAPKFGNQTITFTGQHLEADKVDKIKIGSNECTGIAHTEQNIVSCTIPAGNPGYVNIVLYKGDTPVLTLNSAFEYINVTKEPLKYKVKYNGTGTGFGQYVLGGTGDIESGDNADSQLTLEDEWNGVNEVTINTPANIEITGVKSGWTKSGTSGAYTITSTSGLKTALATAEMLRELIFTPSSALDPTGATNKIQISLSNGLW
ncbi:MAG: IPT/TIG domain-containing protein [Bifidobacteriaceae bacterium]|nr:IPT/TIG domain-containing protein [Bifidobacteriaceae bacterium]